MAMVHLNFLKLDRTIEIMNKKDKVFLEGHITRCIVYICRSLANLDIQPLIHGKINPGNIFWLEKGHMEFVSMTVAKSHFNTNMPRNYKAPELLI